jgi:hypothetical protein
VDPGDERPTCAGDIERYEALRRRAMEGEESGWRLGLAVLQRQGVAAWLRIAQGVAAPSPLRPAGDLPVGSDALVRALTTMALACVGGR